MLIRPGSTAPHGRRAVAPSGPRTILIAIAEPILRLMLQRSLSRRPWWQLLEARSDVEALRLIREQQPRVAILHHSLPAVNARTLLASARGDPRLADLAIVVIADAGSADLEPVVLDQG